MDNLENLKSDLPAIVSKLQVKFPYAYIWCMQSKGLSIDLTFKNESIDSTPEKSGTVISVFNGRSVIEYVIDSLKIDDIKKAADELIKDELTYPFEGSYNKDDSKIIKDFFTKEEIPLQTLESSKKFETLKDRFEIVKGLDLLNGRIFYRETLVHNLFVDKDKILYQYVPRIVEY